MRRGLFALLALILALVLGLAAPGSGHAGGGDNAAVAVNTKDGSELFKLAFAIRRVGNGIVDQTNTALAYSSCSSCRTVAIAIQIVLVTAPATTVTPQNLAIAVNENCTSCQTFAAAYQFVIGKPGPVHFTAEGRRELKEIKQALRDLDDPNLSPDELNARLSEVVARLKNVLETKLVPGEEEGEDENENVEQSGRGPPQTTTEPTATTTGGTETDLPPPASTAETTTETTTTAPVETTTTASTTTETTPTEPLPSETVPTTTAGTEPAP